MKDHYDLWTAARLGVVTAERLGEATQHTFARRGTPGPDELPEGLTSAFADDPTKQVQWGGFVSKSRLDVPTLAEVVEVAAALAEGGRGVGRRGA